MGSAWGIDIGRRAIKGVKLKDSSSGPVVEAADAVDMEIRENATETEKDEAVRSALAVFLKRNGIRRHPVFVSIPGHTTFNRVLRVPVVDEKKLESTIRFEAQQQIPFPIEEVVWDFHPLPQVDPGEMEISLFAVKNDFIRKFLHNMELAGLEPAGIQIAPLALFNFARFELDIRGSNIIIDMGSDATDLLVIDHEKTWMRTVPLAGNDITKALQDKFKLPFEEAEKLKIKSASSKQAQKIFGVMKPVLTDVVSEVDRSLSYYRSQVPDVEFKECLLLGSAGKLVGIRKFLREALEVDVTRATTLNKMSVGPRINIEFLQANLQGLSVAMGLALQALGKAANNVNFLPRRLAEARETRTRRPWYAGAAAMLILGALFCWWGMDTLRGEWKEAMKSAEVLETFQGLEGDLARLQDDREDRAWIEKRRNLAEGRDALAGALRDAVDALFPADPADDRPDMWILKMDIAPAGPGGACTVQLRGAMENTYEKTYREKVAALGEDASQEDKDEAFDEMRKMCELEVKSLVLDPLREAGARSPDPAFGLQRAGTFVKDLAMDIHKGTKFYHFKLLWTCGEED